MATPISEMNFLATHMRPIDEYPEDTECSICKEPISDPVKVACESEHIFCKVCVSAWLSKNNTCPLDRETLYELPEEDYSSALEILRLLAGLRDAYIEVNEIRPMTVRLSEELEPLGQERKALKEEATRVEDRIKRHEVQDAQVDRSKEQPKIDIAAVDKLPGQDSVPAVEKLKEEMQELDSMRSTSVEEAPELLEAIGDILRRGAEITSRRNAILDRLLWPLIARWEGFQAQIEVLAGDSTRFVERVGELATEVGFNRAGVLLAVEFEQLGEQVANGLSMLRSMAAEVSPN